MDAWIANLSDGSTHNESWVAGEISPWQKLMAYCKKNDCYVTNLRLTMGTQTVACPTNAIGYWQAHGMPAVQGVECDEDLHKWKGIGWVDGTTVNIIWGARDPQTHQVVFWQDSRPSEGQGQIIWGVKPEGVDTGVMSPDAPVKNLREFSDRIL